MAKNMPINVARRRRVECRPSQPNVLSPRGPKYSSPSQGRDGGQKISSFCHVRTFYGTYRQPLRSEAHQGGDMAKPAVIVVGADKGGVGKTTVSRTLLDYFSANNVATRAFDTESPRGT